MSTTSPCLAYSPSLLLTYSPYSLTDLVMSKKRVEREVRAAHRRAKKERQADLASGDDFAGLNSQLGTLGLALRQVEGDGNCLFRALGDQEDGEQEGHARHRAEVVQYMRDHRDDFEPFVEDDISWEEHLASLGEVDTG